MRRRRRGRGWSAHFQASAVARAPPASPAPAGEGIPLDPETALLVTGDAAASLGTYFALVAMAELSFHIAHSVALMSLQLGAGAAAGILLAPLGGRLADRAADRRRLWLAGRLCQAVVAVLLALTRSPRLLVGLSAASAAGAALSAPASGAFLVDVFGRGRIVRYNASRTVAVGVARLAGPLLAGLVLARCGVAVAFAVDALGFALSAAAIAAVRPRRRPPQPAVPAPAPHAAPRDLPPRAGYGPLLADPLLRFTLALRAWSLVGQWGVNSLWLVWIQAARFGGPPLMGAGMALYEGGSIAAGLLLPRLSTRPRTATPAALVALEAACWCAYPFVHGAPPVLALSALEGACAWLLNLLLTSWIQVRVPESRLGAALAAEGQVDAAGHLGGVAAGALAAPALGLRAAFGAMALTTAVGWGGTRAVLATAARPDATKPPRTTAAP